MREYMRKGGFFFSLGRQKTQTWTHPRSQAIGAARIFIRGITQPTAHTVWVAWAVQQGAAGTFKKTKKNSRMLNLNNKNKDISTYKLPLSAHTHAPVQPGRQSQMCVAALHVPCPEQSTLTPGQPGTSHKGPRNPVVSVSHTQRPLAMRPWPVHSLSQPSPVYPG
jgi:hypothetical protein